MGPKDVQSTLKCTPTERKRWTEAGYLPVVETKELRKYGKALSYDIYDDSAIRSISPERIESWRNAHKQTVKESRKMGAQKATATREEHQKMRELMFQDVETEFARLGQLNEVVGATYQLAHWTLWASRWAKENQVKSREVRTPYKYYDRTNHWYELKYQAIRLLVTSPVAKLSFYQPPKSKARTYLCEFHREVWRDNNLSLGFEEFLEQSFDELTRCDECDIDQTYYSLYFLEINSPLAKGWAFSFHTPYPVESQFMPHPDLLPRVSHDREQEGMFRFGRALRGDEKIIYSERGVERNLRAAIENYKVVTDNHEVFNDMKCVI